MGLQIMEGLLSLMEPDMTGDVEEKPVCFAVSFKSGTFSVALTVTATVNHASGAETTIKGSAQIDRSMFTPHELCTVANAIQQALVVKLVEDGVIIRKST